MRVNSDDALFEAVIAKAAKDNIDLLNDYGEDDPFTKTAEFDKMMDDVYASIKKTIKKSSTPKKRFRPLFVLAASLALILLLAFNVSALRIIVYKTYFDIRGDILHVKTNEQYILDQYAQITQFEDRGKMLVPGWLPKGTVLESVIDERKVVILKYIYSDDKIIFTQSRISSNYYEEENEYYLEDTIYRTTTINVNEQEISIVEMEGGTGKKSYTAVWNNGNTVCSLKATMPKPLFEVILYSMKDLH